MLILETKRLILRTLEKSEADLLLNFYLKNLGFFKRWIPLYEPSFYNLESQINKIKNEKDLFDKKIQMSLYIFKKDFENQILGNVSVFNIDRVVSQSGFLGYMIDKDEIGNGFASEAAEKIIDYLFNEINLHRIEASVIPENIASVKILEKLNFKKERCSKNYLQVNGKWEDHLRFAKINE